MVFRKGEKDDKEIWVEVWEGKGVVNVRSVGDVVGSVYNDHSFGGIQWNEGEDRFVFAIVVIVIVVIVVIVIVIFLILMTQ